MPSHIVDVSWRGNVNIKAANAFDKKTTENITRWEKMWFTAQEGKKYINQSHWKYALSARGKGLSVYDNQNNNVVYLIVFRFLLPFIGLRLLAVVHKYRIAIEIVEVGRWSIYRFNRFDWNVFLLRWISNSTRKQNNYTHNTTYLPVAGAHFVLTHVILLCSSFIFLFIPFMQYPLAIHHIELSLMNAPIDHIENITIDIPMAIRHVIRFAFQMILHLAMAVETERKKGIYISGLIRWFVSTNERKRRTTIYLVHVWRNLIAVIKTTKKI